MFLIIVFAAVVYFLLVWIPKTIIFGIDDKLQTPREKEESKQTIERVKQQNKYDNYWGYIK